MAQLARDPVFGALTRPQMFAGVTYSYFVLNAVVTIEALPDHQVVLDPAGGAGAARHRLSRLPEGAALLRSLDDESQPLSSYSQRPFLALQLLFGLSHDDVRHAARGRPNPKREKPAGARLPYARHVDDATLETRDGRLMQVLHLAGFLSRPPTPMN